ncbi:GntR family transcriptional regulator [Aestuariivita boseongensis]|uniref:GntR family transcriptional regulator n=1 Tax=Aestuariivita boseongensis TaxID=1470562 RepID=UPI000681A3A7|nr:GntR family transcriptional regulator [Aestuariivita boseongensis]
MNVISRTADAQKDSTANPPAHEVVYHQLRDLVLFGELAPGDAVTIQGLVQRLGAGMTPVREAIRRLIAEGALRFQGNRRVSVPTLTFDELSEIEFLRKTIESQLTERAAQRVTNADIDDLSRIDTALDAAILNGDVRGYLTCNYQFHMTLYARADAPILLGVAEQLWLRFGPSLRVVCGRFGTENLPDQHKELLTALRSADTDAATRAMVKDVVQGTDQIAQVLRETA